MEFDKKLRHFWCICIRGTQKSADTLKKLPPLKHIFVLPTWGQKCIDSELQAFEIGNFDLGHPVRGRQRERNR